VKKTQESSSEEESSDEETVVKTPAKGFFTKYIPYYSNLKFVFFSI